MLPNFLVIGAMKAGTTSLWHYLRGHPEVFMAEQKELRFFTDTDAQDNWQKGLGWYERQFAPAGSARAVGEASPRYSKHPHYPGVPERIAEVLPDVRLIYSLRHPIERMRSQYLHEVLQGAEQRPIDEALLEDPVYLDSSRYAFQIDRYLEHFERDRLLVITAEELRDKRAETIGRVYEFLGVDRSWRTPEQEREFYKTGERREPRGLKTWLAGKPRLARVLRSANDVYLRRAPSALKRSTHRTVESERPELSAAARRELEARLAPDVARLRELVDADVDAWGFS